MEIRKYKVYKFKELPKKAKEKAIKKWYEHKDYPFLSDNLTESCRALLEQYDIKYSDLKLYFSLSYSQGDGLCFIGNFNYKGKDYKITHNYRYYFDKSVSIVEIDKEGNENYLDFRDNENNPFIRKYLKICKKLEKEGYGILDYRMNFDEFNELCEINKYMFLENGQID